MIINPWLYLGVKQKEVQMNFFTAKNFFFFSFFLNLFTIRFAVDGERGGIGGSEPSEMGDMPPKKQKTKSNGEETKVLSPQQVKEGNNGGCFFWAGILFVLVVGFSLVMGVVGYMLYNEYPEAFDQQGEVQETSQGQGDDHLKIKSEIEFVQNSPAEEKGPFDSPIEFSDDNKEDCLKKGNIYHLDGKCEVFRGSPGEVESSERTAREKCVEDLGGEFNIATGDCLAKEVQKEVKAVPVQVIEAPEEDPEDEEFDYASHVSIRYAKYVENDQKLMEEFDGVDGCTVIYIAKPKTSNPRLYTLTKALASEGPNGFFVGVQECTAKVNWEHYCSGNLGEGNCLDVTLNKEKSAIEGYSPKKSYAIACKSKHVKRLRENLE
jgi:hypothetical protein